ncbi:hypothetical protein CJA_0851 [Cellvibrio japonicus Ueda107]|uniref:Macrodomain Ori protein n=1 Tax=Cellvibrio japonicus (strain Ueda107) TaxID=498211 RepID=B3PKU4_CELJU|nr:DUF413 domain-containing protein [Cellvibrio japonicus]ACE83433.1 hypothetical protein CJA_0851 [Cellvibrio japonicus Ueda107]QEI14072.1 DUF413 domain-containing protein [Cellvibrio japonicus]QEI17647.1 DUF413 domain-containing protein [Cellvibrio japonicus]QEI21221.1 DUF413 domain-containing protein [Cellvibrio japonicus]
MLPREHYLKQTFQDGVNFPNGFEKGGLSDVQARLIRKHGVLINALSMDEVSDPTPEDQHILKVIASQSAPKSPIEQAWVKYLNIVKANQANAPAKTSKAKTSKAAKPANTEEDTAKASTGAAKAKANAEPKVAPAKKTAAAKTEVKKEAAKKAPAKKTVKTEAN